MKTKATTAEWSQRYRKALSCYLLHRVPMHLKPALELGCQAAALGMETLELAQIHEQALLSSYTLGSSRVKQLTQTLLSRTAESKVSLQRLKNGILQRKKAEAALLKSGADHARLLQDSNRLRTLVRDQTRGILLTQEKERKKISLGLQDTVAQTLLGFNIELLALKASDKARNDRFGKEIDAMNRKVGLKPKGK
jgi:signal transduction histidine kinase